MKKTLIDRPNQSYSLRSGVRFGPRVSVRVHEKKSAVVNSFSVF